jgi:tetratricopeptide (TPR) repeat protein
MNYQEAISLNNQGVRQYEKGYYEEACSTFRESLETMQAYMAAHKGSKEQGSTGVESVAFLWSNNGPLHAEFQMSSPSPFNFIFRRALVIVPELEHRNTMDVEVECSAIIYNMSLSYHMSGFLFNCSSLLDKAKRFLEIVVALRRKRMTSSKLDADCLFEAAIYNNLGWIHGEFCDYDSAEMCFYEVSARLGSWRENCLVDKQDCEGFLENLIVDIHPSSAAAA